MKAYISEAELFSEPLMIGLKGSSVFNLFPFL